MTYFLRNFLIISFLTVSLMLPLTAVATNGYQLIGDRDDLYFGGGMYGTSGLGVDYAETLMMPAEASFTGNDLVWDGYSNIAFWQMAPTIAWDTNDRLSLGAALNIDYQQVSFSQRMRDTVTDAIYNFDLSLGLLYDFRRSQVDLVERYHG